jgi:hypothetical protein
MFALLFWRRNVRVKRIWWAVALALLVVLVGCKAAEPTATPGTGAGFARPGDGAAGALDGANELALGTLKLEGSENAVTAQQAAQLSPLWQMIGSGSLQGDAEMQAVVKQIEGVMAEPQRAAIEAMGLTFEDMQAWMEEQGIEMPAPPQGGNGGTGAFPNLSEEQRAQMREQFQNTTPEERATRMAELGVQRPDGQGFDPSAAPNWTRGRQGSFLIQPLIELLQERAAQ